MWMSFIDYMFLVCLKASVLTQDPGMYNWCENQVNTCYAISDLDIAMSEFKSRKEAIGIDCMERTIKTYIEEETKYSLRLNTCRNWRFYDSVRTLSGRKRYDITRSPHSSPRVGDIVYRLIML